MGSSVTQQQFKEECEKFGQVEEVTVIMDRETKKSRGCGFVKFVYRDDAVSCYNYHRFKKKFVVEWARSPIHRASQADKYTIFIGNLAKHQADQLLIEQRFKVYGKIEKTTVINRGEDSPVYAFVKYDNTLSPIDAIAAENNKNWDGQIISVELSENSITNKKEHSSSSLKTQPPNSLIRKEQASRELLHGQTLHSNTYQHYPYNSPMYIHPSFDQRVSHESQNTTFHKPISASPYVHTKYNIQNAPTFRPTNSQKLHRQKEHIQKQGDGLYGYDGSKTLHSTSEPDVYRYKEKDDNDYFKNPSTVGKVDSMPELTFPSSLSNNSLLSEAMESTPMRNLNIEEEFTDLSKIINKSTIFMDEDD
ncbi:RNA-binding protein [Entamoeba marina]